MQKYHYCSSECLHLNLALGLACEDCICVRKDLMRVVGRKASHFEA